MPDDDVLFGTRILLRAPQVADAAVLFAAVTSDPKVTEYLRWAPHPDVDETRRVIRELFNVGDDHTWLVVLRDSGEVIGQLGYRRPQVHAAEMGYCMAARWWGRGLMSEAIGWRCNGCNWIHSCCWSRRRCMWTTRGRPGCSTGAASSCRAGRSAIQSSRISA